jgi:hypothetical protein
MAPRKPVVAAKPPRAKPGPKPRSTTPATLTEVAASIAPPRVAAPLPAATTGRQFKFTLNESVMIMQSKEGGTVRARAQWSTGNNSYLIAYTSSRGEFHERWIDEDLLVGDEL